MTRKIISGVWNSSNLQNVNDNFKELYDDIKLSEYVKNTSLSIVETAEKINKENKDVQDQLDQLIIDNGDPSAEVKQARGSYSLLNQRLTAMEDVDDEDPFYHEITYQEYFDSISGTTYYATIIPPKDSDGNPIVLKHGYAGNKFNSGEMTAREYSNEHMLSFAANASLFNMGDRTLLGIQISDGKVDQGVALNNRYILGIKDGNKLQAYPHTTSTSTLLADGVKQAVTAFYPIIENGETINRINYNIDDSNADTRHPRQIIGQDDDGNIVFITVQGRSIEGTGANFTDMARMCHNLKLTFAFNLDGGGSAQTVVRGSLVNVPTEGSGLTERTVPDFLYVDKPSNKKGSGKSYQYDTGQLSRKTANMATKMSFVEGVTKNLGVFNKNAVYKNDLNMISESGLYWALGSYNGVPDNKSSHAILHFQANGSAAMQVAFPYSTSSGEMKFRRTINNDTEWSEWRANFDRASWTPITLLNGWKNMPESDNDPYAEYTIKNGVVYIRGVIRGGKDGNGAILGNIPPEARPNSREIVTTSTSNATTSERGFGRYFIETDGRMVLRDGHNGWFVLNHSYVL